jgi:death-on-curing protein
LPSGRRQYRITLADALSAHEAAIDVGGGLRGIRHLDSIQASISRPYSGSFRSISQKAAALVQAVSGGHGFVDGNKRTALILMDLLTQRSGYELIPLADDGDFETVVEDLVVDLECHRLTLGQVVTWFEARLRRIE